MGGQVWKLAGYLCWQAHIRWENNFLMDLRYVLFKYDGSMLNILQKVGVICTGANTTLPC